MTRAFIARMAVVTATVALASSCTMKSQEAPPLTGPSEYGQSITIAVTPDILPQDGASQSFITITARDAQSQPVRNLNMRTETWVRGVPVDFGVLSSKNVVTGSDGRASIIYTAPPSPAVSTEPYIVVDVVVTPTASDYNNAIPRTAAIRLVPQNSPVPPINNLTANFSMSPAAAVDHQTVLFDASLSTPQAIISEYTWDFGDGEHDSGRIVDHDYEFGGTYVVRLTIRDSVGNTATTSKSIVVTGATVTPTASFVALPNPAKVNSTVTFDASASRTTADARIEKYTWDFGDGTFTSTGGPTTTKVFTTTGAKSVKLFVTDSAGRVSTVATISVNIIP